MTKSKYFSLISAVLFLIILLSYTNSLHSPFHYDDEIVVKHDKSIKDINNYFQLKKILHRHTLQLTYSLNYHWGKMNPFGYHLVNILLHYFTSIIIFIITFITLEKGVSWEREAALKVAFITTLLFALNPVHTETVTYISGRSSGLASFLYFLSLLLFIIGSLKQKAASCHNHNSAWKAELDGFQRKDARMVEAGDGRNQIGLPPWRTIKKTCLALYKALYKKQKLTAPKKNKFLQCNSLRIKVPSLLLYLLSFAAGLMAITTKGISITLPAVVILYDICFMRTENWVKFRTRLLYYYIPLPLLAGTILIKYLPKLLYLINISLVKVDILTALIQFKIISYVLKLYFLPANLSFEYQFPALFYSKELSFLPVLLIFLLILLFAVIKIHKKLPVLSFSILWYLITISPTNSLLPRTELFNDRNLYLPSFGLSLFFAVSIYYLFKYHREYSGRYLFSICSLMIILSLNSALLIKRNTVYKTEISLWEDTLKKSPRKTRVLNNLGRAYVLNGNYELALKTLIPVLATNPNNYYARVNLGKLFADTGKLEMAKNEFKKAIKINPKLAEAYINLGVYYASKGDFINAQKEFTNGRKYTYRPHPDYYLNKASIDIALNRLNDAENAVKDFLKLFPEIPKAHFLLGQIYGRQGKKQLAIEEYNKTKGDRYYQANAHNNAALIYIKQNKFDEAIAELIKAISINPALLEAQFNLGKLFMEVKRDNLKARVHFKRALALKPDHKKAEIIKKMLLQLHTGH